MSSTWCQDSRISVPAASEACHAVEKKRSFKIVVNILSVYENVNADSFAVNKDQRPILKHKSSGKAIIYLAKNKEAEKLLEDALALQEYGAEMLVLECVPSGLAKTVTEQLSIPVIGIGAGVSTSGQVLVLHDILGLTVGKIPRFSKNYLDGSDSVQSALQTFVTEVKSGDFPEVCHEVVL